MANKRRTSGFPDASARYKVSDGDDYRAEIVAKDFPAKEEFRVYRVEGDVTKPDRLQAAIEALLIERGIQRRRILISL